MSDGNHIGLGVNLSSDYVQNQGNTRDNLTIQITNEALQLEKNKFKLALLKNKEKTYEKLIKTFEEEKTTQNQILRSLQKRVFENRINFSDELIMFAVNDITVTNDEVERKKESNELIIATGDSKQEVIYEPGLGDDVEIEWNMNSFEDIQFPNEPPADRKVKFIFKESKISK